MITETKTVNGVASVWLANELETVEYVATVETDIQVGAGGGRYVNDTRVTFDEITLGGEDVVSWEVEDQLRSEVAAQLDAPLNKLFGENKMVKTITKQNVKLELFKVNLRIEDKIVRSAAAKTDEDKAKAERGLESLWNQKRHLVEFANSQGVEV